MGGRDRRPAQKLAEPASLEYWHNTKNKRDPFSARWKGKSTPNNMSDLHICHFHKCECIIHTHIINNKIRHDLWRTTTKNPQKDPYGRTCTVYVSSK